MALQRSKVLQWGLSVGVLVAVMGMLILGREQTRLPGYLSDDTVVATLGSEASPYPAALRRAVAYARATPTSREASFEAARQYVEYGRAIGDARYVGAALGILTPWLEISPDPQILNLAASARQYMHDFDGALALLDQIIASNPREPQALLSRANIYIVQGRFSPALEDCRSLARARRPDLAILCDTTAKALTAESVTAAEQLERMVTINAIDPALTGYAQSLLAEIARFNGQAARARAKFEAALAASPEDLRTLMILVDFDLAEGMPEQALMRMAKSPVTDGIMVRQVEAHLALDNTAEASRIGAIVRGRFEEASTAGDTAHAREAARYWLAVKETDKAVAAATANWTTQRELEDAILLLTAAKAAGKLEAATPVFDWAAAEKVVAPMFLAAARQFEDAK